MHGVPLVAEHHVEVMVAEGAVPREQLVEGVALRAVVVLLDETACVGLVAMVHVHVAHAQLVLIVETEVQAELHALQPAGLGIVGAEDHARAQTCDVALALGLVVDESAE